MYSMGKKLKGYVMGLYMAGRGGGGRMMGRCPLSDFKIPNWKFIHRKIAGLSTFVRAKSTRVQGVLVGGEVGSEILSVDWEVTQQ
jgi:hypothetical protein